MEPKYKRILLKVSGEALAGDKKFGLDEETLAKIINTRENTKVKLSELGFTFPDSKSNFIFATHEKYSAKEIFEYLKTKNIFVRYFNTPGIDNYLRITIGTDEQMDKLFEAVTEFMEK